MARMTTYQKSLRAQARDNGQRAVTYVRHALAFQREAAEWAALEAKAGIKAWRSAGSVIAANGAEQTAYREAVKAGHVGLQAMRAKEQGL